MFPNLNYMYVLSFSFCSMNVYVFKRGTKSLNLMGFFSFKIDKSLLKLRKILFHFDKLVNHIVLDGNIGPNW